MLWLKRLITWAKSNLDELDNDRLEDCMKDKPNFEALTPISDLELGIYQDALDFVFDKDDLKNIAITGAYGAGKSSVLEIL